VRGHNPLRAPVYVYVYVHLSETEMHRYGTILPSGSPTRQLPLANHTPFDVLRGTRLSIERRSSLHSAKPTTSLATSLPTSRQAVRSVGGIILPRFQSHPRVFHRAYSISTGIFFVQPVAAAARLGVYFQFAVSNDVICFLLEPREVPLIVLSSCLCTSANANGMSPILPA